MEFSGFRNFGVGLWGLFEFFFSCVDFGSRVLEGVCCGFMFVLEFWVGFSCLWMCGGIFR